MNLLTLKKKKNMNILKYIQIKIRNLLLFNI